MIYRAKIAIKFTLVTLFAVVAIRSASAQSLDRLLFEDADTPTTRHRADIEAKTTPETAPPKIRQSEHDIEWQLRLVHAQLRAENVDNATIRLQREILARLKSMRQRNSQNQSSGTAGDSRQDSDQTTASPTEGSPGSSPGSIADNSQERDAQLAPADSDTEKTVASDDNSQSAESELLDRAWGHLPPDTIQHLRASGAQEFLPSYREKIQAYFKRLGDLPVGEN